MTQLHLIRRLSEAEDAPQELLLAAPPPSSHRDTHIKHKQTLHFTDPPGHFRSCSQQVIYTRTSIEIERLYEINARQEVNKESARLPKAPHAASVSFSTNNN